MYVRLAFAVAAHLESEILIVDEVLAVGDAEFQKKCLGKIGDVTKGEGRTVLFVSHNMSAIKNLCNKGILLEYGKVIFTSDTESVVNHYLTNSSQIKDTSLIDRTDRKGNGAIRVIGIDLINKKNKLVEQVISGDWLKIRLNLSEKLGIIDYSKLFVGVALHDMEERRVVSFFSDEMGTDFTKFDDNNYIDLIVPEFNLRGGLYDLTFQLGSGSSRPEDCIDVVEKAMGIEVLQGDFWKSGKLNRLGNYVLLDASYE
jgi:lipopolysaccharide transport system ATP-binding protein